MKRIVLRNAVLIGILFLLVYGISRLLGTPFTIAGYQQIRYVQFLILMLFPILCGILLMLLNLTDWRINMVLALVFGTVYKLELFNQLGKTSSSITYSIAVLFGATAFAACKGLFLAVQNRQK